MRSRWMGFVLVVAMLGAAPVAAEQGVTDTEVLLGGSNSFSGPLAFTGTQLTRFGVDLYFRVLNDAGGVLGKKIKPIIKDPASNFATGFPEKAKELLLKDDVAAVFGCWTSASRKAVVPVVEKHDHLLFYPVQYGGREQSPNVVYLGPVCIYNAITFTSHTPADFIDIASC